MGAVTTPSIESLSLDDSPTVPASPTRWGLLDAGVWWVFAQVGPAVVLGVVYGADIPDVIPVPALFGLSTALWFAYGIGPLLSTRARGNGPVADLGAAVRRREFVIGLVVGLVTQAALIPLYLPIERFVDEDPSEAARELIGRAESGFEYGLLAFMVVVAAPLVEEIFYRGLLLRGLLRSIGAWPAIVVQSAIFAFSHFQALQFPGLFVFGVVSGWLATKTGRLGASWAMHVAFNGVALALVS